MANSFQTLLICAAPATGDVPVGAVVVALALSVPLGPGLVAAHAIALASAWAYNAGLKSTPLSIVPFLVSFGLFPFSSGPLPVH